MTRKSYVPDWATHYSVDENTTHTVISFYKENDGYDISECEKISDLHQLFIDDVCQQIKERPLEARMVTHNKYSREIKPSVWVDVYDTLAAFTGDVSSRIKPAVDHAIKKLLAPGKRGVKDERQDLVEARDSLDRAIQLLDEWA